MTKKEVEKWFMDANWSLYEKDEIILRLNPGCTVFNRADMDAIISDKKLTIEEEASGVRMSFNHNTLSANDKGELVNGKGSLRIMRYEYRLYND